MTMYILLILWLVLIFIGCPLYLSLGAVSLLYAVLSGSNLIIIPQKISMAANSFPLLAAPFFILMGNIMNFSGVTNRIFKFADVLVGWMRGGLGHANIIASVIFAGMSGAAVADAGGLGTIEIEAIRKAGYDDDFSCAITAASATIGPIIPPSLPMIIYGAQSETSIGKLFIAGVIPGILMAIALGIMVEAKARKNNYPYQKWQGFKVLFKAFIEAFWALMAPVILLLGIMLGIFTPTEAATVSAFYALILGLFVYKEFKLKELPKLMLMAVSTNGVVLALVMTAMAFGYSLTIAQIPQMAGNSLLSLTSNPYIILLLINIFLLFIGLFMEATAAMLILIPIFMPVVNQMGIDPVQFGIIMVLNLMIGTITPPVGVVLSVTGNIANVSFDRVAKATAPFLIPLIIVLLLVTYVPYITLFLPNLFN